VRKLTSKHAVVFHAWASRELEEVMESRTEVARYTATMTRELCRLCRKVELDDLAYLLEVAAAEAAKVKSGNGARHDAALHTHSG
jgi:hypothetical protein